jgi:hypothetical protein
LAIRAPAGAPVANIAAPSSVSAGLPACEPDALKKYLVVGQREVVLRPYRLVGDGEIQIVTVHHASQKIPTTF